jgi:hypothetical protein
VAHMGSAGHGWVGEKSGSGRGEYGLILSKRWGNWSSLQVDSLLNKKTDVCLRGMHRDTKTLI